MTDTLELSVAMPIVYEPTVPFTSAAGRGHVDGVSARPAGGSAVRVAGVSKRFGTRDVLRNITFEIAAGEFVAIVGRSGCGKSTLLRIVAGLDAASAGTVRFDDPSPIAPSPTRLMFQEPRLLPWKRVIDNVALGLPRDERGRALDALAQVGLSDRADEWPAALSGGQRQRVALARALVHAPRVLLLDEPLGALDALTRIDMQRLIERCWRAHGLTAVLVTHDVQEAVALADRIVSIDQGRVALDVRIDLPRPRHRGDAAFASLEARVLDHVLDGAQAPS